MELDRRYIKQVAMVCRSVTGDDFDGNMVWDRVRKIYEVYFRSTQAELPEEKRNRISHDGHKNDKMLAFICAMLKAKGVAVPNYDPYFPVTEQDLF